jgi:hypothetical protein
MKRYTVTISFEMLAENDVQVYRRANRVINKTDEKFDNNKRS